MHGKHVLWLICLAMSYGVTIQIFENNVINNIFLNEGNFNCLARIGRFIHDDHLQFKVRSITLLFVYLGLISSATQVQKY
jgi:hypothetical protein